MNMKYLKLFENFQQKHKFSDLRKILLDESGETVKEVLEEDLDSLVEHGDFFELYDYDYKVVPMRSSQCHINSANFYQNFIDDTNNSEEEIAICTGWALSNNMWVQHSWLLLLFDDIIIETTEPRDLYYGIILNDKETDDFLFNNM